MEEALSCIVQGCKLARELESNLPNLAKQQPRMLSASCDEIAKIFRTAKERLDAQDDHSSQYVHMLGMEAGAEAQDWLRTSYLQALQAQYAGVEPVTLSAGGHSADREGSARSTRSGGDQVQAVDRSDSGSSNPQRSRRR